MLSKLTAPWTTVGFAGPLLVWLFILCFCFIGAFSVAYNIQLYKVLPGWGPIRKFDAEGTEDDRINQLVMAGVSHKMKTEKSVGGQGGGSTGGGSGSYGSTDSATTWGDCQVPYYRTETVFHPQLGREVKVHYGYSDTQQMRMHSGSWARDEPYYLHQAGISLPVPQMNARSADYIVQRMA